MESQEGANHGLIGIRAMADNDDAQSVVDSLEKPEPVDNLETGVQSVNSSPLEAEGQQAAKRQKRRGGPPHSAQKIVRAKAAAQKYA
jgi:hypothetical protein